jgi:hypothetical protein
MPRNGVCPTSSGWFLAPGSGIFWDMVHKVQERFDPTDFDFSERPFIVIWEITRACEISC